MLQFKSFSKEKMKLGIWIGALAIVALAISQLFGSISADQLGATSPGTPQYAKGAAINGIAVLDPLSLTSDNAGLLTYDCDSKGMGATVAVFPDEVSAAILTTTTDTNCEYFTDTASADNTFVCVFAPGAAVPNSVSEIYPTSDRSKCFEGPITLHEDNYIDLAVIVPPSNMQIGILHVFTKNAAGTPAMGATARVKCADGSTYPDRVTSGVDAKAEFTIFPPEQNCEVTVTDYSGAVQKKTVFIETHPPVTEVTFTVKMVTPSASPITKLFNKVLGVQTAHAVTTKKTVHRDTNKPRNSTAPKAITQGRIAGWVTNANGSAVTSPVRVKLTLISPEARDNVSGRPLPSTPIEKLTNSRGEFDFTQVDFTVNVTNTYKIELNDPAFEVIPTKIAILGTVSPDGKINLSKTSRFGAATTPYKQNGIQVFAQPKDKASLSGNSVGLTDPMQINGDFSVTAPTMEYKGTSSFEYKGNNYPELDTPYVIFFKPADPQVLVEGYYDAATDTKLADALNGKAATVTLTAEKKSVKVVVKLKKKAAVSLTGKTLKIGDVTNDQGKFVISPSNATFAHTKSFDYKFAKLNETYGVSFTPDAASTQVEGYYEESDLNTRIDNTKITLTEAKPSFVLVVKLKKATTNLDVTLVPAEDDFTNEVTVNDAYKKSRKKASEQSAVDRLIKKAGGSILSTFAEVKKVFDDETELHISYRVPNAGFGVAVDKTTVGTTDSTGQVTNIDATKWVDKKPEIIAIQGTVPSCLHVHAITKVNRALGKKPRVTYSQGSFTVSATDPVEGKLVGPNPLKIEAGKSNKAEIKKADFKPENFEAAITPKKLGDGSSFFDHKEKLLRCMDGKSIEAPTITATITPSGDVKLSPDKLSTAKVTWTIKEADGSEITDPNIKATIQIIAKNAGTSEEPITKYVDGEKSFELSLDGNKGRNYDIIIRVKGTQDDIVEKKLEVNVKKK